MEKDIYQEYASLTAQIKNLTNQRDSKKEEILNDMISQGVKKINHTLGSFAVAKLKMWEYPSDIIEMEEDLKARKALAQSTGDAVFTEGDSLRFVEVKL